MRVADLLRDTGGAVRAHKQHVHGARAVVAVRIVACSDGDVIDAVIIYIAEGGHRAAEASGTAARVVGCEGWVRRELDQVRVADRSDFCVGTHDQHGRSTETER